LGDDHEWKIVREVIDAAKSTDLPFILTGERVELDPRGSGMNNAQTARLMPAHQAQGRLKKSRVPSRVIEPFPEGSNRIYALLRIVVGKVPFFLEDRSGVSIMKFSSFLAHFRA
jgi:hypothetical protein